jgi:hypothetical protein
MADQTTNTGDVASNTNTAGAAGNNAQGATNQPSGAPGAPNPSQSNNDAGNQQQGQPARKMDDPDVQAALKTLEEKGVKVHTNGQMAAARTQWEKERNEAAETAKREAEQAARIANGEAQKVAEERQARITTLEADLKGKDERLERFSKHINAQIEAAIAQVPPVLKEFDPGPDNLDARMEWYEKLLKHPEIINGQSGAGHRQGTGWVPQPSGHSGNLAQQYQQSKYSVPNNAGK